MGYTGTVKLLMHVGREHGAMDPFPCLTQGLMQSRYLVDLNAPDPLERLGPSFQSATTAMMST